MIDTQGDAFFVAFRSAVDAVSAAVAAQRALTAHGWPEQGSVVVRMGLHTGEAAQAGERYLGLAVHKAARIGAAGHGGQVLLSDVTRALVEDDLPPDVSLGDLGEQWLKDLDRPERIYQLEIERLPSEFPPLRTGETPFAGREDELAAAAQAAVTRPPFYRRRSVLVGALAGVVAAAIAIPVFALGARSGGSAGVSVVADSIAIIDPATNKVVADVRGVGSHPDKVAVGKDAVWVLSSRDQTVTRVDARTRKVVQTTGLGVAATDLAATADGSAWVSSGAANVLRIAAVPGARAVPIALPPLTRDSSTPCAGSLASAQGSVWVDDYCRRAIFRIDSATNRTAKLVDAITFGVTPIAVGDGKLWYINLSGLTGVDLATPSDSSPIPLPPFDARGGPCCSGLTAGEGAVWLTAPRLRELIGYESVSGAPRATSSTGIAPAGLTVGGGSVWVANGGPPGTVSRFGTARGKLEATIRIGQHPSAIAAGQEAVWVAVDGLR